MFRILFLHHPIFCRGSVLRRSRYLLISVRDDFTEHLDRTTVIHTHISVRIHSAITGIFQYRAICQCQISGLHSCCLRQNVIHLRHHVVDHLVEFCLDVHDNGLGYPVIFFFGQIRVIGSVISSCQKHGFQSADIRTEIGRDFNRKVKYLCSVNIVISGAIAPHRVCSVLWPERCIESRSLIRLHGHLVTGAVLHEINAFDLHGYASVSVFRKAYIGQFRQFIQNLVSRIPQVIGMLNATAFHCADLII